MVEEEKAENSPSLQPGPADGDEAEKALLTPAPTDEVAEDKRGKGEVIGDRKIRKRQGSSRTPGIFPGFWRRASKKVKAEAIKDYLYELEQARLKMETELAKMEKP